METIHKLTDGVVRAVAPPTAVEPTFDIVLMDIQMPELDGLSATREIRHAEAGTNRHIPIVALTAHAMKGDRERALASGCDEFDTKPIDFAGLLQKMEQLLRVAA